MASVNIIWLESQPKSIKKMFSIIRYIRDRLGLTDVAAATESGLVTNFNEKTIQFWRIFFYSNGGEFSGSCKGKHDRSYVLDDEECREKSLKWLCSNAYAKHKLTLQQDLRIGSRMIIT